MNFKQFFLTIFLTICLCNDAFASLLVSPTRIAFDGRDRTKQITVINPSNVKQTYRLEWKEQTADNFGSYSSVTDINFNHASKFLRFSPRQVTLEPGERQVVKLLLRKTDNMPKGEYRSHLQFTILPDKRNTESSVQSEGISMKLDLLLSYSIPIIVKQGSPRLNVNLDTAVVKSKPNGEKVIEVKMSKTAEYGATGNVIAYYRNNENKLVEVARLNSVNFFHESSSRIIKLVSISDIPSDQAVLMLRYIGVQEFSGDILAEKEFSI